MDSREEIAMDEWFQKNLGTCQTCEHYYKGFCNHYEEDIEYVDDCQEYCEMNLAQRISDQRKRMYEKIKHENARRT